MTTTATRKTYVKRAKSIKYRFLRANGALEEANIPTFFCPIDIRRQRRHTEVFVYNATSKDWSYLQFNAGRDGYRFLPCPEPVTAKDIGSWMIDTSSYHDWNGSD